MGDRNERWIIVLVLAAAGLVLAAPVVGRLGAAALADVVMGAAAAAGLAAWGLAGVATVRAARRAGDRRRAREEER